MQIQDRVFVKMIKTIYYWAEMLIIVKIVAF